MGVGGEGEMEGEQEEGGKRERTICKVLKIGHCEKSSVWKDATPVLYSCEYIE